MEDLVSRLIGMGIEPIGGEQTTTRYSEHRTVGPQGPSEEPSLIEPEKIVERATEVVVGTTSSERAEQVAGALPATVFQVRPELVEPDSAVETGLAVVQEEPSDDTEGLFVQPGDRVLISYNDEPSRQYTLTLSPSQHDPDNFVIYTQQPLAQALMGWSEEDEVEIPAGGRTRTVTILRIERPDIAVPAAS